MRTTKPRKCYEEQATVQDVRSFRHLRLHALKGAYQGKHALDLHDRWRLIGTFEEGLPARVEIEEVGMHYGD